MNEYVIYTDGGNRNTGVKKGEHERRSDKSAYAYRIVDTANGKAISGTHGYYGKTNNQMEVLSVVRALERLVSLMPVGYHFRQTFKLYSDSHYVDDAVNCGWLAKWKYNGYRKRPHSQHHVKNYREWRALADLLPRFPHLTFHWVRGHADERHPKQALTPAQRGNIYCDTLLNHTMDRMNDKR